MIRCLSIAVLLMLPALTLSADTGVQGVRLAWDAPAENPEVVATYRVYRSKAPIPDDIHRRPQDSPEVTMEAELPKETRTCAIRLHESLETFCDDLFGQTVPHYYRIVAVSNKGKESVPSNETVLDPTKVELPVGKPLGLRQELIIGPLK